MVAVLAMTALAGCRSDPPSVVGGGARDVRADDVAGRPWPERISPSGPWSGSIEGSGLRLTLTVGGTIVGALGRTSVDLGSPDADRPTSGRALAFPDGQRWYPQQPFRLEAEGDLPFRATPSARFLDSERGFSVEAAGRAVTVRTAFDELLAAAGGQVAVTGEFLGRDGVRVDDLVIPAGTLIAGECPPESVSTTSSPFAAGCRQPTAGAEQSLVVTVDAAEGMTVQASGDGEVAVAGDVRAKAEGKSWDGLVVALEGPQIAAFAAYDGRQWSVSADATGARQVWVDVWPVVDTVLEARSFSTGPGFFDRSRLLRVEWINVGHATGQIMEAEGIGPGASGVGFDLNKSLGHDAGLDVRRGDRVVTFKGGADVDSNLAPGGKTDRELSYRAGQPATLVLRGNFPEVRVELAVPGA
jgi:hypothetical protein